jgi:hypothetical protein
MNEKSLHQLVYCSRNQIKGTEPEVVDAVQIILSSARKNNACAGITGALLFNEGLFAQVLEGPVDSVEQIFEKIQRDPRHSDVTVLQSSAAERREFSEWSMAFAARSAKTGPGFAIPAFGASHVNPSLAGKQVLALLHELVVQEDWMVSY